MIAELREGRERRDPGFASNLERRAALLARPRSTSSYSPIAESLRQEIALTVDLIRRACSLADRADREIALAECEVGTDLLQLDIVPPRYVDDRWSNRQRLKARRRELATDRRRAAEDHEKIMSALHDRLLTLLQRHDVLENTSPRHRSYGGSTEGSNVEAMRPHPRPRE